MTMRNKDAVQVRSQGFAAGFVEESALSNSALLEEALKDARFAQANPEVSLLGSEDGLELARKRAARRDEIAADVLGDVKGVSA